MLRGSMAPFLLELKLADPERRMQFLLGISLLYFLVLRLLVLSLSSRITWGPLRSGSRAG